ncbi:beta-hexosaminidase subunit alpha-like [Diabrotica undecimpunctata]|uniref:beta-hexosaminidase subunit alpha-like n=1 Tax=Diabrotica undecimpunctata TaxID=50387 RepID=UPI003B63414A
MEKLIIFLLTLIYVTFVQCYIEKPGPRYPPTKGEIWPKPSYQIKNESFFLLDPETFEIKTTRYTCSLIKDAIVNYEYLITKGGVSDSNKIKVHKNKLEKTWLQDSAYLGVFDKLEVRLDTPCDGNEYPSENMMEAYTIRVSEHEKLINSSSIWGILRGLESFSQMVYIGDKGLSLRINRTFVEDIPRFSHRGLLLDTSRHFLPLESILLTITAMSYNKMNVFHWHIVDDHSFPYSSKKFPELSEKGAYTPYQVYSYADIQTIIEHARLKGIRVIPEFDTPGHTRSWGVAHPEILTACGGELTGNYGPIDPTTDTTYEFLYDLFTEIHETFADRYIHIGGDEVGFECWGNTSKIVDFMKEKGITNFEDLESFYIKKVIDMIDSLQYQSIVWEEVFTNGVELPKNTVIQVWKDFWNVTLLNVTTSNRHGILSSCWYLDNIKSGGDWLKFYDCDPHSFTDDPILRSLVKGGEACMWGEVVNQYNVISRVWPRTSAVAEKLWSQWEDKYDEDEVRRRLEEHTCRMNRRGIAAQPPNGPGFCY